LSKILKTYIFNIENQTTGLTHPIGSVVVERIEPVKVGVARVNSIATATQKFHWEISEA
jgi:hypothetical protein